MKRILFAAVAVALSVSACDEASAPEGREGTLAVAAYIDNDATGSSTEGDEPLAGLTITVSEDGADVATAQTGANGIATFPDLPPGSYLVRMSGTTPPGAMLVSNPEPNAVINFRGDPVGVDFQFTLLPATISGRVVRLSDDAGAENVMVVLTRAGTTDTVATTTTSETGAYQFGLLEAGAYDLEFERAGAMDYGTAGNQRTVTLVAGEAKTMDVNYTGSIYVTVAEARASEDGTRVAVIADITVPAGRFTSSSDTRSEIWVQDATGGIAVFSVATEDAALYGIGQRVEVVGLRSTFSGQEQISGNTASPLVVRQRTGGVVHPAKTITAAVARTLADEGRLVRVAGLRIVSVGTANTSGAFSVTAVSATDDTLGIRVHGNDTELEPADFTVGTSYDVTGVLTQNNATIQIKPRSAADVVVTPVAGSGPKIIINEIMARPAASNDANGEWVELYNYGSTDIDLQNWYIADNFGIERIAASLVVPAGGYVVLGSNADQVANTGAPVAYDYISQIALGNSGDRFTLRSPDSVLVDSIAYTSSAAVTQGASRGVIDASADNADVSGANWAVQTSTFGTGVNRGTPGAQNDTYVAPAAARIGTVFGVTPASATPAPSQPPMAPSHASPAGASDR